MVFGSLVGDLDLEPKVVAVVGSLCHDLVQFDSAVTNAARYY